MSMSVKWHMFAASKALSSMRDKAFFCEKRESDAAIREAQAPSGRGGARALMHTHTHTLHLPGVRSFRYPLAGTTGHKNRTMPRCN